MKAVVLCGGEGTRLRPFTYSMAKHLLPVAGRPVVEHSLAAVREAGITDVGIVVSPTVAGQFKDCLGDGSRLGLCVSYVVQPEPKGLAHAVLCAKDYVGENPFLVYLGDNLLEAGVRGVVDLFRSARPEAAVSLARVEDPRRFGVAVIEDGKLVRLVEKPQDPPSNLAIVGAYAFTPAIFQAAREVRPSFRGELELTDCLQWLLDRGHSVLPHEVHGWWQDVGRPGDLLVANWLLLGRITPGVTGTVDQRTRIEGPALIEHGALVERSQVIGPVVIREQAVVTGSTVGPRVAIGPAAELRHVEIENSIVMAGARIEGPGTVVAAVVGCGADLSLPRTGVFSGCLGSESTVKIKEEA